eukprot:g5279.t1
MRRFCFYSLFTTALLLGLHVSSGKRFRLHRVEPLSLESNLPRTQPIDASQTTELNDVSQATELNDVSQTAELNDASQAEEELRINPENRKAYTEQEFLDMNKNWDEAEANQCSAKKIYKRSPEMENRSPIFSGGFELEYGFLSIGADNKKDITPWEYKMKDIIGRLGENGDEVRPSDYPYHHDVTADAGGQKLGDYLIKTGLLDASRTEGNFVYNDLEIVTKPFISGDNKDSCSKLRSLYNFSKKLRLNFEEQLRNQWGISNINDPTADDVARFKEKMTTAWTLHKGVESNGVGDELRNNESSQLNLYESCNLELGRHYKISFPSPKIFGVGANLLWGKNQEDESIKSSLKFLALSGAPVSPQITIAIHVDKVLELFTDATRKGFFLAMQPQYSETRASEKRGKYFDDFIINGEKQKASPGSGETSEIEGARESGETRMETKNIDTFGALTLVNGKDYALRGLLTSARDFVRMTLRGSGNSSAENAYLKAILGLMNRHSFSVYFDGIVKREYTRIPCRADLFQDINCKNWEGDMLVRVSDVTTGSVNDYHRQGIHIIRSDIEEAQVATNNLKAIQDFYSAAQEVEIEKLKKGCTGATCNHTKINALKKRIDEGTGPGCKFSDRFREMMETKLNMDDMDYSAILTLACGKKLAKLESKLLRAENAYKRFLNKVAEEQKASPGSGETSESEGARESGETKMEIVIGPANVQSPTSPETKQSMGKTLAYLICGGVSGMNSGLLPEKNAFIPNGDVNPVRHENIQMLERVETLRDPDDGNTEPFYPKKKDENGKNVDANFRIKTCLEWVEKWSNGGVDNYPDEKFAMDEILLHGNIDYDAPIVVNNKGENTSEAGRIVKNYLSVLTFYSGEIDADLKQMIDDHKVKVMKDKAAHDAKGIHLLLKVPCYMVVGRMKDEMMIQFFPDAVGLCTLKWKHYVNHRVQILGAQRRDLLFMLGSESDTDYGYLPKLDDGVRIRFEIRQIRPLFFSFIRQFKEGESELLRVGAETQRGSLVEGKLGKEGGYGLIGTNEFLVEMAEVIPALDYFSKERKDTEEMPLVHSFLFTGVLHDDPTVYGLKEKGPLNLFEKRNREENVETRRKRANNYAEALFGKDKK